jgi:hypothetical protein
MPASMLHQINLAETNCLSRIASMIPSREEFGFAPQASHENEFTRRLDIEARRLLAA